MQYPYRFFLLLFLFLSLFSIVVSGFEFDNVKDYDPVNKEVTITNSFGLGSEIAKVKLLSPEVVYAIPGKDRLVAEFEVYLYPEFMEDYKTEFKATTTFDTYDINKAMKTIDRSINMKYASEIETIYNPTYETTCEKSGKLSVNGSEEMACTQKLISNETIIKVKKWENFEDISN